VVFDKFLLLIAYCTSLWRRATGFSWLSERGAKSALLSSYNNSSSPRRDTDQLCGDW
jgi:hypothetical protein